MPLVLSHRRDSMSHEDRVVVTNPDPTEAVKEALRLAVETINEKFAAAQAAVVLAHSGLQEQLSAMSAGINDKFAGNKELVDQLGKANAVALNAALETQKDLLRQLKDQFDTSIRGVNEKIDRLTSRMDTGEGGARGASDNRQLSRQDVQDSRQSTDSTRTLVFALITVGLVALGIVVDVLIRK